MDDDKQINHMAVPIYAGTAHQSIAGTLLSRLIVLTSLLLCVKIFDVLDRKGFLF